MKRVKELKALRIFCRWMCDLYQYNHAMAFSAVPSFPSYDNLSGVLTDSLLPETTEEVGFDTISTISCSVKLPSFQAILQILSPSDLIKIRKDLGSGYIATVKLWQSEPTGVNENKVVKAINEYSSEITKFCFKNDNINKNTIDVMFGSFSKPSRNIIAQLLTIAGKASAAGIFIALGKLGYEAYRWRSGRLEDYKIEIHSDDDLKGGKIDINFPEQTQPISPKPDS